MIKWILSSSILIGVVMGLRYLFRGKISARLQYALWALVLIRLLMPTGIFHLPFSVENIVGRIQAQPAVQDVITDLQEPGLTYKEAYDQAEDQLFPNHPITGQVFRPTPETAEKITDRAGILMRISTPSFVIENVLRIIWYIGIGVVVITFLLSNIKFKRKLHRNRQLLHRDKPLIYTCEGLDTPCLFGFFRPAIYLTPEDAQNEQRSAHILAHERTHLKHWDHVWSFLRCLCLALHWYNPLVWIAAIASRQDGELACDEATVKKLGEEQRIPYGETLVQTTCAAKSSAGILGIATTMTGSKEAIKQRILRIAKKFKFNVYAFLSVLLVGAISIGCTWFGASPENEIVTVYLLDRASVKRYSSAGASSPTVCRYDDNYNLISASGVGSYTYDENNRLISKSDAGDGGSSVEYIYNSQGQIIQCDEQFSSSSHSITYTYDEHGRVIRQEEKKPGATVVVDYSYDENGVLRASRRERTDGSYGNYKTYNADGNLIKNEIYNNGKLYTTDEYTYDLFGRVMVHSSMRTGYNNSVYYHQNTYTYDIAGRLTKIVYNNEGSVNNDPSTLLTVPYTIYYRYDLMGNLVERVTQNKDSDIKHSHTITYDINGRIIRYYAKNYFDLQYTYDGNGNILTECSYSSTGTLMSVTTYSYIAVQVPKKDAERLLAQQDAIIDFLFESLPYDPMPEKETFYP